ncbi:MAG: 2-C-methyl-D-erythritol 4-phosphate cytidylyltransferase [Clostridia bacterium]|nr:2-C-methyl-D-erythritol 4-phosphate cytidylyltransferase [Clostridia bacterium]
MTATDFKIEYSAVAEQRGSSVPVVIVAAGSSSRMGGVNKIFASVAGVPVIARTMLAFQRNAMVSEIVVVTQEAYIADIKKLCDEYMITKIACVTKGGNDRLSSVLNGLNVLNGDSVGVMIHDGARPFPSDTLITKMAKAALEHDCSVCAVAVKDTIKEKGERVQTPERSRFVAVQTPQSLNYLKYKELLMNAYNKEQFTDDASVMEKAGFNTVIIDGEESNIKITTPIDLILAEAIAKEEGKCE